MRPARVRLLLIATLLATVIVYLPAMRAPFVFDDGTSIPGNPTIRTLWPLSVPFHPPDNTTVAGRPIANYSLAINYAINEWLGVDQRVDPDGASKTVGYHVVNLLIHLGCGLLLFGIIRRTLRHLGRVADADSLALAVAALWLLHPIQTEAVNFLVQRTEVLVSLCYAGTLYAWIRGWDASSERARVSWRIAAVLICLVGMGSKEVMITAPIVVILYDRAFRETSWKAVFSDSRRLLGYGALAATAAWTVAMTAANARFHTAGFGLSIPWYTYLYSQCWAIARYLLLVVWPRQLTFDYGQRAITGFAGMPGAVLLIGFGLATILAWIRGGRWIWFGFTGATFFLLLAPSSSVVPIVTEIAAERRIYLALAPVLVLAVLGAEWLIGRLVSRSADRTPTRALRGAFVVVVFAFAVVSFVRSRTYASAEALWRDTVNKAPNNPRGYDNLAGLMFYDDPPRLGEARALYEKAIAIDSTYVNAWRGLASVAADEGRLDDAERLLKRVLAIQPGYSDAVRQIGRQLFRGGHPDRAIPYLVQYATAYPSDTSWTVLGLAYLQVGRLDSAVVALRSALAENPSSVDAMRYLGGAFVEAGQGAEAIPVLERLISAGSRSPVDLGLLGLGYAEAGHIQSAVRTVQIATQSAAGNVPVLILAGRAMVVAHRLPDAIAYLSEALRFDPGNKEAAAYMARARSGKSTP